MKNDNVVLVLEYLIVCSIVDNCVTEAIQTFLAHQTEIATLFAWVINLHLTQVFSPRLSAPKNYAKP